MTKAANEVPETKADTKVIDYFTKKISFGDLGLLEVEREDVLSLEKNALGEFERERIYFSEPIKNDFGFNAYAIRFKAEVPEATELNIDVRPSENSLDWKEWQEVWNSQEPLEAGGRDDNIGVVLGRKGAYTYSELIFPDKNSGKTNFLHFRVTLKSEDKALTPNLDEVIIETINTLETEDASDSKAKAASAPNVISRAGWGANESWMSWTPEYRHPENFFVHHTVTTNNGSNPPATVRAIYYYHAIVRGWGDIGYNYLIDQHGNIYEGRRGGNGVVGGHVRGYNYGSIGISLLGDFHPGSEARGNGSPYLTGAATSRLEDLMAWRAYDNNINPLGTWYAGGAYPGVKPNIAGHRDSGATACPGDYLYARLNTIRHNTYNKYQNFRGPYRLLRESNNPEVYLLIDGEEIIRHIINPAAFNAWNFNWNHIETVDLANYEKGSILTELAKDSQNKIYLANLGIKFYIPNSEIFQAWGFDSQDVSSLPDNFLNYYSTFNQSLSNLIKAQGNPKVYLVEDGTKWHIRDPLSFAQWGFNWGDLKNLPSGVLNKLDYSGQLSYLVQKQGEAAVYLVNSNKKIHISNPAIFGNWGFKWSDISLVSQTIYDKLETHPFLLKSLAINSIDNKVYMLSDSKKYYILTEQVLNEWGFNIQEAVNISSNFLNHIPSGKSLSNLIMQQGQPAVYLVDSGKKWHIKNPISFEQWGFKWSDIQTLDQNIIDKLSFNGSLSYLIQEENNIAVYLVDNKTKRHIPSPEIFISFGFKWADICILPAALIDKYLINGTPLYPVIKAKSSPEVYVVGSSKKYHISNPTDFNAWGFDWNTILEIDKLLVNAIPYGGPLPSSNRIISVTSNKSFSVRDSTNALISAVTGNNIARSSFANGKYFVKINNFFKVVDNLLKFTPDNPSDIIRVISYNDIPSWNSSLNDNKFRGSIIVQYSSVSNKLWVINELLLEDYLKGIAEASTSAPFGHLKTLTVAARSYAYYHLSHGGKHSGEPFHLKNSRHGNGDDQVYKGYGLESRWPALSNAVNQTSSQVVTYGGTPVITPYFSRSDGRTRSWTEVWGGGHKPWCVSVPDPDCNGMTKLGHGVGLSSYGAMKRAERGNSYQSILSYYYQSTGIGNIGNPNIRIAIYGI